MHSFLIYTNKKLNKYIDKYTHTYIPHGPQLLYPRVFPREMLTAVFKEQVSLGPLRSRYQNQRGCARDLLEKTSVRNRGKGPGKSRETLQTMTKIWHLWKEKREEHWGGRPSDHNAVWRKHKSVQWGEVSHCCPGILCVLGQTQQPCHAQSSVGNSPGQCCWAVMDAGVRQLEESISSAPSHHSPEEGQPHRRPHKECPLRHCLYLQRM